VADHHHVAESECLADSLDVGGVAVDRDLVAAERWFRRSGMLGVGEVPQVDVDQLHVAAQVLREDPGVEDARADDEARLALALDHVPELGSVDVDDARPGLGRVLRSHG
jgi:hypothetical protein